ncbi:MULTISPECIES: FecR family protein [unclassified Halorhodospira]|uniref:FecR family protein n=1 Tax=unclassified Halorhodospira TaxID=2626748 RepID=UPI001EE8F701|nr:MULTISPECIES: FecR family protein [unclassified Halorhodospira]MCG5540269.1 FecR domain-containing protein [Halorhodospira sp. M39old]MCG5545807.1 FecR domain-containing protein [Halorhodospira sp. M38]
MTTEPHRPAPAWALAALLSGTATLAPLTVAAEERIGIVLANRGDPVLIRDGEEQSVGRRDEIRAGDRLRTDERSRLQMRLEDGQTLSLTENTELHIEAYAFDEESGTGESRKSLIEGGLRAITGQISGEGDYTIETEVATIGIRGTIFELAHGDGGTAGGTPRGRGFAENRGDSRQRVNTGDDAPVDYFRVTDPELPPEALSERPAELDALDEPAEAPADDAEETEDEAAAAPPGDEDTEETEDGGALAAAEDESEVTPEPTSDADLSATGIDASAGTDTDALSSRQDRDIDQTTTDAEDEFLVGIEPGAPFFFIEGDAVPEDDPRLEGLTLSTESERDRDFSNGDLSEVDGAISNGDPVEIEQNSPATGTWGDWIDDESGEPSGPGIRGEAYLDTVDEDLDLTAVDELGQQLQVGVFLGPDQRAWLDGSVAISAEDQTVTLETFQVRQITSDGTWTWHTDETETNLFELATGIDVTGEVTHFEEESDAFTGDLAAMLSEADDIIELLGAFDFEADNNDWAVDGVFFLELDE